MAGVTDIIGFLLSHPVALVVVTVLGIALVVSIIKKIIKAAIIILIISVVAGGIIYNAASDAIKTQGERILDDVKETLQGN